MPAQDPTGRPEAPSRSLALTLREWWGLAALFLWPTRNRSQAVYDLLGGHNSLAERSMYVNLGYWEHATTFDEAGAALARRLGQRAGLGPGDEVLDVGCGFGDQDGLYCDEFGPARLVGLNLTASQVEVARRRVQRAGLRFEVGSATAMPFPAASFDVVIGLESAFHFDPRSAFFAEAARVLRPGGRLALADVVPRQTPSGLRAWWMTWLGAGLWQVPLANFHDLDTYRAQLAAAGFVDVQVEDVSAHVFRPFKRYAARRVLDTEVRERVHPLLRALWGADHGQLDASAYLLITARRG